MLTLDGKQDFLTGPKDDLFVSHLVVVEGEGGTSQSAGLLPPPSAAVALTPATTAGPSAAAAAEVRLSVGIRVSSP